METVRSPVNKTPVEPRGLTGIYGRSTHQNPANLSSQLKIYAAGIKDIARNISQCTHLSHKTVIGICIPATPGVPVWAVGSFKDWLGV